MTKEEAAYVLNLLKRQDLKINSAATEAIDMAIAALEKQKPVKVDSEWDRYYGKNNPCCGACGAYVDEYSKYCKRCGRPIDWSD